MGRGVKTLAGRRHTTFVAIIFASQFVFVLHLFLHLQLLRLHCSWMGWFVVRSQVLDRTTTDDFRCNYFCIAVIFAMQFFLHLRLLRLRRSWMGWFGVGGHFLDRTRRQTTYVAINNCIAIVLQCSFFCICSFLAIAGAGWAGFGWVCIFFCIAVFFAFLSFLHLRLLKLRGSWVDWFGAGRQEFGRTTTRDFRCYYFCIAFCFCIAFVSAFAAS